VHALSPTVPTCSASSRALSPRDHRCQKRRRANPVQTYATVASDEPSPDPPTDIPWPEAPKGHSCPTPYQIFDIPRNAPYTKTRFYQLVKLYHPDRSLLGPDCSATNTTSLERYRLIVTAHTILSDPVKRSAYDRWGAGWAGKADIFDPASARTYDDNSPRPGPFSSWRENPDPIWANATWEDWERWRIRNDPHSDANRHHSAPVFMQNAHFISLVMFIAVLGSSWNYSRAEGEGERFLAARDAMHDRASKDLRNVRRETGLRAKEERIEWFLRNREASRTGLGVEEIREERARRWLPEQEGCLGEALEDGGGG